MFFFTTLFNVIPVFKGCLQVHESPYPERQLPTSSNGTYLRPGPGFKKMGQSRKIMQTNGCKIIIVEMHRARESNYPKQSKKKSKLLEFLRKIITAPKLWVWSPKLVARGAQVTAKFLNGPPVNHRGILDLCYTFVLCALRCSP